LCSLPAQQHTDHITKLKTFPVSTSWTYSDLLRVSTCKRMTNLRGCHFFIFVCCDYLISTDTGLTDTTPTAEKLADIKEFRRHFGTTCLTMSATEKNVCCLKGVADRHICQHCQPRTWMRIPFCIPVPVGPHFSESAEFRGIPPIPRNTRRS